METAALVVGAPPAPAPAQIEAARATLGRRYRLVGDDDVRAVLEGFARRPPPAAGVREALDRAHQALRRLELGAVKSALAEARARSTRLPPTAESAAIMTELALREATLAQLEGDERAEVAAMTLALSIDPDLRLDPDRHPPALTKLLSRVRAGAARATAVSVHIESQPPGAAVIVAGRRRGVTPFVIEVSHAGPQLVWLTRDGSFPRAVRTDEAARGPIALEPLDAEHRLGPLVDAVRQIGGERRPAAEALAAALGVDAIAVLDGDRADPTIYALPVAEPVAPSREEPPSRWSVDALDVALAGAGAIALAVGTTYLVLADRHAKDADGAPDIAAFERERERAESARRIGLVTTVAGGVVLAAGVVRYVLRPRSTPAPGPGVTGFVSPSGAGLSFTTSF
jgi:hypothetical protein